MVKSQDRFGKATGGGRIAVTIRPSSGFHILCGKSGGKIGRKWRINSALQTVYFVAKIRTGNGTEQTSDSLRVQA